MALFNKNDDLVQEANRVSKEAISCIISKDMSITGEISFKGKARIDGQVEGNIRGGYLVLSESGRVKGDLDLEALICHGTIEGNIQSKLVTTHSTAKIKGKLQAGSLTVEPGAVLVGEVLAASNSEGPKTTSSTEQKAATLTTNKDKVENKKT